MQNGQDYGKSLTAFSQYLREVKWIPQLTPEEEKHILQCLVDGVNVQRWRERLVEGCQDMIMSLARRFARDCQHMEFLDFVQEGNIGLLQAIKKYDVRRDESSFKTLAFSWVRGHMLMAYWRDERARSGTDRAVAQELRDPFRLSADAVPDALAATASADRRRAFDRGIGRIERQRRLEVLVAESLVPEPVDAFCVGIVGWHDCSLAFRLMAPI